MMNRTARCTTLALLLATTEGCAVGPDFQRPAAPATHSYVAGTLPEKTASAPGLAGEAQRFAQGQEVQALWWKAFGSPALDELVAAALQANPDLKAAEAALRAARETAAAQRGAFWPGVDAGVNSTRQKTPGPLAGPLVDSEVTLYTLHTAQLSIGYVPDVFGANRRQVEALAAEVDVQRFQREAVYMTLVSNVVNAAIEEASLRAQIAATRDLIELATRLLDISRRQHRAGQVGGADVAAQEAALAQAQASLPSLEKQLAGQRNRLAVLAGRLPSEQVVQRFELTSLSLPSELPVTLQAIVSDAQAQQAASAAEAAARKSLGMARRQRELGAATQAELILAQQTYQEAALALVQAQASRYTNTVALYQALGGWWQVPESAGDPVNSQ